MKLCIEPTAEGFLVYMDGDQDYGEPVASLEEALEAAAVMLGGDMPMEEEIPPMEGEEEFVEGFKGPSGY